MEGVQFSPAYSDHTISFLPLLRSGRLTPTLDAATWPARVSLHCCVAQQRTCRGRSPSVRTEDIQVRYCINLLQKSSGKTFSLGSRSSLTQPKEVLLPLFEHWGPRSVWRVHQYPGIHHYESWYNKDGTTGFDRSSLWSGHGGDSFPHTNRLFFSSSINIYS